MSIQMILSPFHQMSVSTSGPRGDSTVQPSVLRELRLAARWSSLISPRCLVHCPITQSCRASSAIPLCVNRVCAVIACNELLFHEVTNVVKGGLKSFSRHGFPSVWDALERARSARQPSSHLNVPFIYLSVVLHTIHTLTAWRDLHWWIFWWDSFFSETKTCRNKQRCLFIEVLDDVIYSH